MQVQKSGANKTAHDSAPVNQVHWDALPAETVKRNIDADIVEHQAIFGMCIRNEQGVEGEALGLFRLLSSSMGAFEMDSKLVVDQIM
jgi:hypothetical protein